MSLDVLFDILVLDKKDEHLEVAKKSLHTHLGLL